MHAIYVYLKGLCLEELGNWILFREATLSWFKKIYFLINVFRKITRPGGSLPFTTELKLSDQIFILKSFRFVRPFGSMIILPLKPFFLKLYLLVLVNFNLSLPHHALGIILLRFVGEISLRDVVTIGFARPSTNRGNKR